MGMFSYICPACRTPINGTERVHFRHIRHGIVLGETEGKHDGYGRVYGTSECSDPLYRAWKSDLPKGREDYHNTHEEICKSEFGLPDSIGFDGKIYEGEPITWIQFRIKLGYPLNGEVPPQEVYDIWDSLPKYEREGRAKSGTSAYHVYCWNRLTERQKNNLVISDNDKNQGWGAERSKYL